MSNKRWLPKYKRRWFNLIKQNGHITLLSFLLRLKVLSKEQYINGRGDLEDAYDTYASERNRRKSANNSWYEEQSKHRRQDVIKPTKQRRF